MGVLRKTGENLMIGYVKLCAILFILIFTILAPIILLITGVSYLIKLFSRKSIWKLMKSLE